MNNYGLIIKLLRQLQGHSIKTAARIIGKSVGWLSEIENGKGLARINETEFERIIRELDGLKYRSQFKTWVATQKAKGKVNRSTHGAILKQVRVSNSWTLHQAAQKVGISSPYLCSLENGHKPIKLEMRNRIMRAYGYSPSSFCNLSANEKRAKSVPARYKINTLLNQLDAPALERVLQFLTQEGELS